MTYNLNNYRHVIKPIVVHWLQSKPNEPVMEQIASLSLSTSCPIVAVCYFVGEIKGFTPELLQKIESLKAYYRVTDVEGVVE